MESKLIESEIIDSERALNISRRNFLMSALATSVVVGITGCRTFDPKAPMPTLTPNQTLIDTHCHVFNAADIPVAEFIEYVVLGELKIPGVAKLSGLLINAIACVSTPGFQQEKKRLEIMLGDKLLLERKAESWVKEDASREQTYVQSINAEIDGMVSRAKLESLESQEEKDFIEKIYQEIEVAEINAFGVIDWYTKLVEAGKTIGRYLLWGYKMTRYRYQQIEDIKKIYPEIKLFTPALVDFDHWFDIGKTSNKAPCKGTIVSIEKQMQLMVLLNRLFKGTVHPFVGFDPRRDVETNGESLKDLKRYIQSYGAIGVKLYPPMGFKPIGNKSLEFCNSKDPLLGEKLDQSLWALYDFCNSNQVPIMAHTANSNTNWQCQAYDGRGNPESWQDVLDKFNKLKINFSHFVTDEMPGKGWNKTIRELIIKYDNIYTDLSHVEQLTKKKYSRRFFSALKKFVFHESEQKSLKLKSRLLYGSDWIMLEKEKISRDYLRHMTNQFDHYIPDARDRFIGGNAIVYLGLGKGKLMRLRLESFYTDNKMEIPDWLKSIH